MSKSTKTTLLLLGAGLVSGAINGMLGAGGGILITYFLTYLMRDSNMEKNDVFAHALLTMLPISVLSFVIYLLRGYVKLDVSLIYLVLPAALGGILGAFLLKRIKFNLVKLLFIALVIYSGVTMLF